VQKKLKGVLVMVGVRELRKTAGSREGVLETAAVNAPPQKKAERKRGKPES